MKTKLTLRDLFALVTLAAVLVAWWVDHRRLAAVARDLKRESRLVKQLEQQHDILLQMVQSAHEKQAREQALREEAQRKFEQVRNLYENAPGR